MLAKIAVGALVTVALLTTYVLREGFLIVRVDETSPQIHHIHLWLPATFASAGLAFAPKEKLRKAAEKAGPWLDVARTSCRQLEGAPDFTLADVTDPTDLTSKSAGAASRSPWTTGTIKFSFPYRWSRSRVTDRLQSARPAL